MGRIISKVKKLATAVFIPKKKEHKNLEEELFSIVKALKKEEKKILKASYSQLNTPLDNQIARLRAKKFPLSE